MRYSHAVITQARSLRSRGRTYAEIERALKRRIPKSTLSHWSRGIRLPAAYYTRLRKIILRNIQRGRRRAWAVLAAQRRRQWDELYQKNAPYRLMLKKPEIAKLVLAALYLGEGSKTRHGSMMFGNSDPAIVSLFLGLLRVVYQIDEKKLRCTVQCRADQNIRQLERFWSKITAIPPRQFYAARVDPRSVGVKSRKKEYRGVCRIDYFSAAVYHECLAIGDIITNQPKRGPIFQW